MTRDAPHHLSASPLQVRTHTQLRELQLTHETSMKEAGSKVAALEAIHSGALDRSS